MRNERSRHTDAFKFVVEQPNILTQMEARAPVSAINRMVIRGLNIILLMSTGVIAAEVCIFAPMSALFTQPNSTLS
jgi:hypothetical protein